MDNIITVIKGKLVDEKGKGLPNLRVEAWDKDFEIDDALGSALTKRGGKFSIEFDEDTFSEFGDRQPDLYFKIYENDKLIATTLNTVLWNQDANVADFVISLKGTTKSSRSKTNKVATVTVNEKTKPPKVGKYYDIVGKVTSAKTSQGISDLRIDVFGLKVQKKTPIESNITAENGVFDISILSTKLDQLFKNKTPQLYFKISQRGKVLLSTENHIIWTPENNKKQLAIAVQLPVQEKYVVYGSVQNQKGDSIGDVPVVVYKKSIAKALVVVKEGKTNNEGKYEIDYSDEVSRKLGGQVSDLIVKASVNGTEVPSELYVDAPKRAEINIIVPNVLFSGKSQFEKVNGIILSVFKEVDIKKAANNEDTSSDVIFLAEKLKISADGVNEFMQAYKLLTEADTLKADHNIPVDIFYGLIKLNGLATLKTFVSYRETDLRHQLHLATSKGIIQRSHNENINNYSTSLKQLSKLLEQQEPKDKRILTAKRLVASLGLSSNQEQKFLALHTEYARTEKSLLWQAIEQSDLGQKLNEIKAVYTLSDLTQSHATLINKLNTDRQANNIDNVTKIRHLAKKNNKWWEGYLQQNNIDPPVNPDTNVQFSVSDYAAQISTSCKSLFPMVAFIQSLKDHKALPADTKLATALEDFIEENPDFHFSKISVNNYWEENKLKEKGIKRLQQSENENEIEKLEKEQEVLKEELRTWARLYALGSYSNEQNEIAIALRKMEIADVKFVPEVIEEEELDQQVQYKPQKLIRTTKKYTIHSGSQIARLSKKDFFKAWSLVSGKYLKGSDEYREKLGEKIYQRARKTVFALSADAWRYSAPLRRTSPAYISGDKDGKLGKTAPKGNIPNISELFGSQDYFESEHCESVLSPAAYYAEIFHSMSQAAIDRLAARRPDLLTIQLNCANTNRELPCIDLIIEQLERRAITNSTVSLDLQTTLTEDELSLRPEYVLNDAYVRLASECYPLSVPWDKWYEEAQLYLNHMNIPLYRLIELHISPIIQDSFNVKKYRLAQLNDQRVVMSYLNLTVPAYYLITEEVPEDKFQKIFPLSFELDEHNSVDLNIVMQVLDCWQDNFKSDPNNKEFINLRKILETRYVQDSHSNEGPIEIYLETTNDQMRFGSVRHVTRETLIRLIKFERLRKALSWSSYELHLAMMNLVVPTTGLPLPTTAINHDLVVKLSHIERLRRKIKQAPSVPEILSLWGNIDTGLALTLFPLKYQSEVGQTFFLYDKIYLDKSLFPPGSSQNNSPSEKHYFELNPSRQELNYLSTDKPDKMSNHLGTISAALQISVTELYQMLSWSVSRYNDHNTTLDRLTIKSLSMYYRMVFLAKYLDLTTQDLMTAIEVTDIDPFVDVLKNPNSLMPSTTILFVEAVQAIQISEYSIQDLAYFLQHVTRSSDETRYINQQITQQLKTLQTELFSKQSPTNIKEPIYTIKNILTKLNKDCMGVSILDQLIGSLLSPRETIKPDFSLGQYINGQTITGDNIYATVSNYVSLDGNSHNNGDVKISKDHFTNEKTIAINKAILEFTENLSWNNITVEYRKVTGGINLGVNGQNKIVKLLQDLDSELIEGVHIRIKSSNNSQGGVVTLSGKFQRINQFQFGGENMLLKSITFKRNENSLIKHVLNDFDTAYVSALIANLSSQSTDVKRSAVNDLSTRLHELSNVYDDLCSNLSGFIEIDQALVGNLISKILPNHDNADRKSQLHDWILWINGMLDISVVHDHFFKLYKLSELIKKWQLNVDEVVYINENKDQFSGFLWESIPVAYGVKHAPEFDQWMTINEYVDIRRRCTRTQNDILNILIDIPVKQNSAINALSELLNVDNQEIISALRRLDYFTDDAVLRSDVMRNGNSLTPILEIAKALKILGRSFRDIEHWVGAEIREGVTAWLGCGFTQDLYQETELDGIRPYKIQTVNDIRKATKSRKTAIEWQQTGVKLQNQLREIQRDRLLSFVKYLTFSVTYEQIENVILVDPRMGACFKTTRLKQAISSLQTFIQNVREHKEDNLQLEDIPEQDWWWIDNYRVWEAAKKIFLFPENWLEPEFRHNKSAFFEEFEDELLQGELNDKTIAKSFRNYMNKITETSNLEIVAFEEYDQEIHVIGRTREVTKKYFYSKRDKNNYWHPWERVDLDIESEIILITVFNDQLYLFWPTIQEEVIRLGQDNENDKNNEKNNYLPMMSISMNWSIYNDGSWLPRRHSHVAANFMYHWRYKELFEHPKDLLTYVIKNENDRLDIEISCMAYQKTTTSRFSWNQDALDYEFNRFRKLVSDIDWTFIHGTDFHIDTAGMLELVNGFVSPIETNVRSKLYRKQLSSAFGDVTKLAEFKDNQAGNPYYPSVKGELAGALMWPFYNMPLQYDNHIQNANDGTTYSKGLSLTDYKKVVDTFKEFKVDNHRIKIEGAEYVYLDIGEIEGDTKGQVSIRQKNQFIFGTFSFSSNSHRCHVKNGLGLSRIKKEDNDWKIVRRPEDNMTIQVLPYFSSNGFFSLSKGKINNTPVRYHLFDMGVDDTYQYYLGINNNKLKVDYIDNDTNIDVNDPNTFPCWGYKMYYWENNNWGEKVISLIKTNTPIARITWDGHISLQRYFYQDDNYCYLFSQENNINYKTLAFCSPLLKKYQSKWYNETIVSSSYGSIFHLNYQSEVIPFPYQIVDVSIDTIKFNFALDKPFAIYNWELFYHVPMTIAVRLMQQKQYEQAQRWFHYIFNPLSTISLPNGGSDDLPPTSRYWNTLPLHKLENPAINSSDINSNWATYLATLETDPFQPHRVAQHRWLAYQKATVMRYLDNLIAWGDHLFEQDSIESINEAMGIYLLAADILGPRPRQLPTYYATTSSKPNQPFTVQDITSSTVPVEVLEGELLYELNDIYEESHPNKVFTTISSPVTQWFFNGQKQEKDLWLREKTVMDPEPIFRIPNNEKMLKYWDTVSDRLFKIRHCQDIEGMYRQLPIFEPPIDIDSLVRGEASGIELADILSEHNIPLPPYRFQIALQKAMEICGDVKSLGGLILSAMEKRDSEALSLLRAKHEKRILEMSKENKENTIRELRENVKATRTSRDKAIASEEYYLTRKFENRSEMSQVHKLGKAHELNIASQLVALAASGAYAAPQFIQNVQTGSAELEYGGRLVGDVLSGTSRFLSLIGSVYSHEASLHSIQGGRERRMDDWQYQAEQARRDIKQIDKQVMANEIRLLMAEKELLIHKQTQSNSKEIKKFLEEKLTSSKLYHWMLSELSGIYYQMYRMGLEMARVAQRCYQQETGRFSDNFITAGHWDNLKKGLLAGEKLQYELRRMDIEYLQNNSRDHELIKDISLKCLDPLQLDMLRFTGSCELNIPELLFDLDYPGHYFRRIKSISISIPSILGPYGVFNCTLSLNSSKTRLKPEAGDSESIKRLDLLPIQPRLVLSKGQNDSGMFEYNLNEGRYLPFENTGVESNWTLSFDSEIPQFDYSSISDVILHMRYTARFDSTYKELVKNTLDESFNKPVKDRPTFLAHKVDVKRDYPDLWHEFRSSSIAEQHSITLEMSVDWFPYILRAFKNKNFTHVTIFCEFKEPLTSIDQVTIESSRFPSGHADLSDIQEKYIFKVEKLELIRMSIGDEIVLSMDGSRYNINDLSEFILVFHYEISK